MALHYAAKAGRDEMVKQLVENGAEVNAKDSVRNLYIYIYVHYHLRNDFVLSCYRILFKRVSRNDNTTGMIASLYYVCTGFVHRCMHVS